MPYNAAISIIPIYLFECLVFLLDEITYACQPNIPIMTTGKGKNLSLFSQFIPIVQMLFSWLKKHLIPNWMGSFISNQSCCFIYVSRLLLLLLSFLLDQIVHKKSKKGIVIFNTGCSRRKFYVQIKKQVALMGICI